MTDKSKTTIILLFTQILFFYSFMNIRILFKSYGLLFHRADEHGRVSPLYSGILSLEAALQYTHDVQENA